MSGKSKARIEGALIQISIGLMTTFLCGALVLPMFQQHATNHTLRPLIVIAIEDPNQPLSVHLNEEVNATGDIQLRIAFKYTEEVSKRLSHKFRITLIHPDVSESSFNCANGLQSGEITDIDNLDSEQSYALAVDRNSTITSATSYSDSITIRAQEEQSGAQPQSGTVPKEPTKELRALTYEGDIFDYFHEENIRWGGNQRNKDGDLFIEECEIGSNLVRIEDNTSPLFQSSFYTFLLPQYNSLSFGIKDGSIREIERRTSLERSVDVILLEAHPVPEDDGFSWTYDKLTTYKTSSGLHYTGHQTLRFASRKGKSSEELVIFWGGLILGSSVSLTMQGVTRLIGRRD